MCRGHSATRMLLTLTLSIGAVSCGRSDPPQPAARTAPASRQSHQDWPTGHYKIVEGWPKPLPDTRHSHDGWTWGSFGGVYAESPDRVWVAMRGELPLPKGAAPWTPYAALTPSLGNATGNADGLSATWRVRSADGSGGRASDSDSDRQATCGEWPHLEEMFSSSCGCECIKSRSVLKDAEKHVDHR